MWYEGLLHTQCHFLGELVEPKHWFRIVWSLAEEEKLGQIGPSTFYCLGINLRTREGSEAVDTLDLQADSPFESVVDFLCLIHGKAIVFDGMTRSGDLRLLIVPSVSPARLPEHPCLNAKPRIDYPLNNNIAAGADLLRKYLSALQKPKPSLRTFLSAVHFYAEGVRDYDRDGLGACLSLITSIECLAGVMKFEADELRDPDLDEHLGRVSRHLPPEEARHTVSYFESRMFRVARRFRATLSRFVDDAFFQRHDEGVEKWSWLPQAKFQKAMSKAYDLRSKFLHEGSSALSEHLKMAGRTGWETSPVRDRHLTLDQDTGLPTLLFMERVVRYVLLRYFIQEFGDGREEEA